MNKVKFILLYLLFIISRLFFINTKHIFFDSDEYLNLFSYPNYFSAIISGHAPPHEGYIILFWPVFHLAQFLHIDPAYTVIVLQILLACLIMYCFYQIVVFLSDKRTALIASVIASLTPLFWIINVTIMMEIAYITFFFLSLYLLTKYLKKSSNVSLHVSSFFFTLAFLTHPMTVIWLPFYLAIVWVKNKKKLLMSTVTIAGYLTVFILVNTLFLALVSKENFLPVFHHLYLTKGHEIAYLPMNITGFLIAMRNFLLPLLRNNTSLIVILGFVSLIILFIKNKKLFLLSFLWIAPALYANQWWDSLLNGRHAVIAGFGFAFIVAYLLKRKKLLTISMIIYLLIVSLPALNLLRQPIPYIQEAHFVKTLPKDSLLIETHFAKPQVEKTFQGKLLAVNDPLSGRDEIGKEIDSYLSQKKPIFISSGALSEPYGLYSGPYLHNITLSYTNPFQLTPLIKKYTLKKYQTLSSEDNLIIYQIISDKPAPYPEVKHLRDSYRRLDYYDPLWRIWALLKKWVNFFIYERNCFCSIKSTTSP